jgi:hypothetical protein
MQGRGDPSGYASTSSPPIPSRHIQSSLYCARPTHKIRELPKR